MAIRPQTTTLDDAKHHIAKYLNTVSHHELDSLIAFAETFFNKKFSASESFLLKSEMMRFALSRAELDALFDALRAAPHSLINESLTVAKLRTLALAIRKDLFFKRDAANALDALLRTAFFNPTFLLPDMPTPTLTLAAIRAVVKFSSTDLARTFYKEFSKEEKHRIINCKGYPSKQRYETRTKILAAFKYLAPYTSSHAQSHVQSHVQSHAQSHAQSHS